MPHLCILFNPKLTISTATYKSNNESITLRIYRSRIIFNQENHRKYIKSYRIIFHQENHIKYIEVELFFWPKDCSK